MLYSLLAIGFALVYNTTRVFHIAAAGVYVFAAYMFWLFTVTLHLSLLFAALIAVMLTMGLSLTTEVTVYRPLKNRKASLNVAMIASIGLMTVIVNTIAMFFGDETKVVENSILKPFSFGDIIITPQMYQAVIGIIILAVFLIILRWTIGACVSRPSEPTKPFSRPWAITPTPPVSRFSVMLASSAHAYLADSPWVSCNRSRYISSPPADRMPSLTFLVLLIFLFLRPQGIVENYCTPYSVWGMSVFESIEENADRKTN